MGQSVLKQHDIGGRHFVPYGYFAAFDDDGFQLPLRRSEETHAPFIDMCIQDFGLQYRNEPGLSVIVPFPRISGQEVNIETPKMLAAIVDNYFYPIIAKRLEVSLYEGEDRPPILITSETIDEVLAQADLEDAGERSSQGYKRIFDMCRKSMSLPEHDYVDMQIGELARLSSDGSSTTDALRQRYDNHEMLGLRIYTDVQMKDREPEDSEFRLYVQRDDSLNEGHDYYVRGTLSISQMNYIEQIRARSLLVVNENERLAAMLRDSEPPAHTLWRPQAPRVVEHWVAAKRRIEAVRYAPRALLRAMDAPREGLQKDAFADIFSLVRQDTNHGHSRAKTKESTPPRVDIPSSGERDFTVYESSTGFRVRISDSTKPSPKYASLKVAYDVPRGNPLKRYRPTDFVLRGHNGLNVMTEGCDLIHSTGVSTAGNELLLQIDDPKLFSIAIQGFDPNRDVYVRVERITAPPGVED